MNNIFAHKHHRKTTIFSLATIIIFISLFAGLIPLGYWRPDEFGTAVLFRDGGLEGLKHRLFYWSPRPFSEILLYGYFWIVVKLNDQFITAALSILWMMMFIAILVPSVVGRPRSRLLAFFCFTVLLFLIIAGQKNSEALYWIQGSSAYIPTIVGLLIAFGVLVTSSMEESAARFLLAAGLSIAALSSETGAFLVGGFTALTIIVLLFEKLFLNHKMLPNGLGTTGLLFPFVCSIFVGCFLLVNRTGSQLEVFGDTSIAHSVLGSGTEMLRTLPNRLFKFGDNVIFEGMRWAGIPVKLLFGLGCYLIFQTFSIDKRSGNLLLLFGIASVSAIAVSSFASYFQFGLHCCERHSTMEQVFAWMAIGSVSAFFASHFILGKDYSKLGISFLMCACFITMAILFKGIIKNYQDFRTIEANNFITWSSGNEKSDTVILRKFPPASITQGGNDYASPGVYNLSDSDLAWHNKYILDFFKKDKLIVE